MPRSTDQKSPTSRDRAGAVDATISREIVEIYTEYYGRGPTRAKTSRREELVICLLEEVFGKAEAILVAAGKFDQVRLNRVAIRAEIEPRIRAAVEAATGSPVTVCMGDVSAEGLACEIFLLDPAPPDAAP